MKNQNMKSKYKLGQMAEYKEAASIGYSEFKLGFIEAIVYREKGIFYLFGNSGGVEVPADSVVQAFRPIGNRAVRRVRKPKLEQPQKPEKMSDETDERMSMGVA